MNKIHTLKTWPEYYKATIDGEKTFEVRLNDRGFEVGDALVLQEFNPDSDKYTGEMETFTITYLLESPLWLKQGYVVMSIRPWVT